MKQAPEAREILSAIDQVKTHKIFNRSPLMCAFLSYVTLETIQGRASRISAYSVAVDALGKPTNFDPQMDPSVRVLAKRLRDSLARYYDEATDYKLCVVMKPGSYVPSYHQAEPSSRSTSPSNMTGNMTNHSASSVSDDFDDTVDDTVTAGSRGSWGTPILYYCADDVRPNDFILKKPIK